MVELLAPAGNPEALEAAIAEGADAVYLGLKSFNARMRSSNFAWNQFEATVDVLHKRNKKIYVTVNTVVTEDEMERLYRFLTYLNNVGPDGIIVQDLGLIQMAHKYFPQLKLHASTQLNIASAKAANTMSRWGISRTVLARELSLEEIRDVHANTSCELEVFVHGALCVSESGLCLFSSYLGGKSANRGMCTQACRRLYTAHEPEGDREGYFFSPADLQLIEYIPDLIQAGVASFKIEGRMKSAEYVGTVVSAYRYVIDNWEADKKAAVETGKRILANDFARKKTSYRFKSTRAEEVLNPDQAGGTGIYLGIIDGIKKGDVQEVPYKDGTRAVHYVQLKDGHYTPEKGDSVRIHKKDDSGRESWKIQDIIESKSGAWLQLPADSGKGDSVYLLQTKAMTKRYPHLLPASLEKYRRQPNDEALPMLTLEAGFPTLGDTNKAAPSKSASATPAGAALPAKSAAAASSTPVKKSLAKKPADIFPEGLYVQVSSIADLHTILADKPVRVIINLNEDTYPALSGQQSKQQVKPLPFPKREIFISLDPFVPQEQEPILTEQLEQLTAQGYTQFIVNNPAHISMLRNKKNFLVAGPYLYTFNCWAVSWLQDNGICAYIPPAESSQANIETVFAPELRPQVLLPLFSYSVLFRMRFTLPKSYNFLYFSDKQGEAFRAFSTPSASFVLSDKPFSVVDRYHALQHHQFSRFLLDFSHTTVERRAYRFILQSLRSGTPLPDSVRFNWKEGFYDPQRVEELKQLGQKPAADRKAKPSSSRARKSGHAPSNRTNRTEKGQQRGNRKR
ncbi:peptidase, U32 family [Treponema vincentii ATCC 35580]|uniref:Peptidase, U32 family n=1 Tax=Treponema vincentii ATCC 35580 TaxID=596324 RepID=C8PP80_9SPIR|nr:peptidase U32 family protein [Treponema vincentii]EEV20652.1 peptidase, U32 family [Treponema vincentii ATCC 35580]